MRYYGNDLRLSGTDPGTDPTCPKKPEHESQVRPLVGLGAEQVQLAWEHDVEKAGRRKITGRSVRLAMQELQLGASPAPVIQQPRRNKPNSGA